jgi:hypothetical protein
MKGMPSPRPSLVAREDLVASDDDPSGKVGMTVGTEGEMLGCDDDEEEECVKVDAMMDIVVVVVIGASVDNNMLEVDLGTDCELVIHPEGVPVRPMVVSDRSPLHVGNTTGLMLGTDSQDGLVLLHEL